MIEWRSLRPNGGTERALMLAIVPRWRSSFPVSTVRADVAHGPQAHPRDGDPVGHWCKCGIGFIADPWTSDADRADRPRHGSATRCRKRSFLSSLLFRCRIARVHAGGVRGSADARRGDRSRSPCVRRPRRSDNRAARGMMTVDRGFEVDIMRRRSILVALAEVST
jgi:hypothetical protein